MDWKRPSPWIKPSLTAAGTALGITGVVLALQSTGLFQLLEWAVLDRWFQWRLPSRGADRVVLVTISETDIAQLGQWPISDEKLADLITTIQQQQPRVIGLDIYRDLPVGKGHDRLQHVFASTPNLIGIEKSVSDGNGQIVAPPTVLDERDQVAASDLMLDSDGKMRRTFLSVQNHHGKSRDSLGAKLAWVYLKAENIGPIADPTDPTRIRLGSRSLTPLRESEGGYVNADIGGYQVFLNFQPRPLPQVSVSDVLNRRISPTLLHDRVVLIGSTAASTGDHFYTPLTTTGHTMWFGVEIHAQLTDQLLRIALDHQPPLSGMPEWQEWLWIFGWAMVGASLGWWRRSLVWTTTGSLAGIAVLFGSAYGGFLAGWWVIVIAPGVAATLAGGVGRGALLWNSLRRSHQALAEYSLTLEQKVLQRTQELLEKNHDLERAMHTAESANRAKTAFLANMSHELRTPLTVILGFTELLSDDRDFTSEQQEHLTIINRSGEHLLKLIDDVLALSRMEVGNIQISAEKTNLIELLDYLSEIYHLKATTKQVAFQMHVDSTVPEWVMIDGGKVRQILTNLLDNAMKFTVQGDVSLDVRFQKPLMDIEASGFLQFDVTDTGPGIPKNDIEHIFETFVQSEAGQRANVGAGLGLAIVQQFVHLLGGKITVQSVWQQGSTFSVVIPAERLAADKAMSDCPPRIEPDCDRWMHLQSQLARQPSEWLQELQKAASRLSYERCGYLVDTMPDLDPSIRLELRQLLDQFQFDTMVQLIQRSRTQYFPFSEP